MSATTTLSGDRAIKRPIPKDTIRILNDCRDLAIHRLLLSFASMLDRVGELLMVRAERSDVREMQTLCFDAREVLIKQRPALMADFEKHLRHLVSERMAGKELPKADFSEVDARKLTLVDTESMDESVLSGNIVRVVENLCHDELRELNRGVGYLLGRPDLETAANPLAPTTIVAAFTEALHEVKGDHRIKLTILKELNQTSLGDINAIYADVNRHLEGLKVVPQQRQKPMRGGDRADANRKDKDDKGATPDAAPPPEIDLMAVLQRLASAGASRRIAAAAQMTSGADAGQGPISVQQAMTAGALANALGMMSAGNVPGGDLGQAPATGPFGGPRILVTPELGDALSRLQHGESNLNLGGVPFQLAGLQQDMHNVLRDLQESPLGAKANQLEAMTIELVAMLFDFIFETKDLPDSIKALIGRLQMPVLRAAMLDGAFFSKKSHPSRLLVNALAHAGIGWSPTMGQDDPLYRKIESIVHRVLDDFTDDIGLFDELRVELETFLADEDKSAEAADSVQRRRDRSARSHARSRRWWRARRSSSGCGNTRRQISSPVSCATNGSSTLVQLQSARRRGQRRLEFGSVDARRSGLERAAEARDRRPQAPGRDAAQPAQAPARRAAQCGAGRRASANSSCPTWSRPTPRP